jgi:hypothetical protein
MTFFLALGCSSWFLDILNAEVDDARDDSWSHRALCGFTWLLRVPMWGLMRTGQPDACIVLLPMDDRQGH